MTCLHYAAFHSKRQLIQILMDAGFDVNKAVKRGSIDAAEVDAKMARSIGKGLTALHAAAFFCRLETVQALLDTGADPSAHDGFAAAHCTWLFPCALLANVAMTHGPNRFTCRKRSGTLTTRLR
jgi:hypothetical protein